MKLVIRLCFIVASPLMVFMYMKNSFRNVDNLHVTYDLKYAE